MADPNLVFDPVTGHEDETVFVTNPTSKAQTRSLMQRLHTQTQTWLNTTLISWINSTFATITNLNAAVLSGISDDSVTDAKLSATAGTVKDRVNVFLADGGITDAKLSGAAGTVKTLSTAHYIDYYKHGLTGTTDSSGSNTVYTLTPSPNTLSAYAEYLRLAVIFDKANGGACTINVSGLGAKSIKKVDNTGKVALVASDILALVVTNLVYDGTDFILLNPVINDIPKSIIDAAGDLIIGSGDNTPTRLAIDATAGKALISNVTTPIYGYPGKEIYTASDTVILTANTERSTTSSTYTTLKSFKSKGDGSVRVKFQFKLTTGGTTSVQVLCLQTGVVTNLVNADGSGSYTDSDADITILSGLTYCIQVRNNTGAGTSYIRNLTVCASLTANYGNSIVD